MTPLKALSGTHGSVEMQLLHPGRSPSRGDATGAAGSEAMRLIS
jgi:hypothetical protein